MEDTTSFYEVTKSNLICRTRKRSTPGCLEYELFETENNYQLFEELRDETYEISPSDAFIVTKPVPREVFAGQYRDRNVHHLIMERKMPIFEQMFINDSYSCRKGKGTLYGINRIYEQIKIATNSFKEECFIVRGDYKSFFMLINKEIIYQTIEGCLYNDWEQWIYRKVIFDRPQDRCIFKQPRSMWKLLPHSKSLLYNNGMPIGNLPSQILVNLIVTCVDKAILQYPGILGYGRYVDDFIAIFKTCEECEQFIEWLRAELLKVEVILHPDKTKIVSSKFGAEFIGSYIKPHRIYISNRSKQQFSEKMYTLCQDIKPENLQKFLGSINSYLGYLQHRSTYRMRYKIIFSKLLQPWLEYCYPDENLTKLTPFKEYLQYTHNNKSKWYKFEYVQKQQHHFLQQYIHRAII